MWPHNEIERSFGECEVAGGFVGWPANHIGQFGRNDQNMECRAAAMHSNHSSALGRCVGTVGHREFLARHIGQSRQENLHDGVAKSQLLAAGVRGVIGGAQFVL